MSAVRRSDSRSLLRAALDLYSLRCERLTGLISDGPDGGGPGWAYSSGRGWLERRAEAEPFELDELTWERFDELAQRLSRAPRLEEEIELLERFPRRVAGLLERRRDPNTALADGRRWLDQQLVRQADRSARSRPSPRQSSDSDSRSPAGCH